MRKQSKGVTAMDLLVTMTMATILMVIGVPGLQEYGMNQQIKSALSLLHSDLKLARNDAISLNARTVACPGDAKTGCAGHSQWNQGWLVFADLNDDRQWQNEEPLLREAIEFDGLSISSPESRSLIRFFPGGTAPGSNTSIVFCDRRGFEKGQKIVLSNSGRMRQSALTSSDEARCPLR